MWGENGSVLVGGSSSQDGGPFLGRKRAPGLVTEISSLVRGELENERGVSLPLYCPILPPLGEEGPGETGDCCLATRGASGSMGMADEALAPSLALSLISPSPAETWWGGSPGQPA